MKTGLLVMCFALASWPGLAEVKDGPDMRDGACHIRHHGNIQTCDLSACPPPPTTWPFFRDLVALRKCANELPAPK
jgi:hypothetical protein